MRRIDIAHVIKGGRHWACSGRVSDTGEILDCDAPLGDEVYDSIEAEIRAGRTAGEVYGARGEFAYRVEEASRGLDAHCPVCHFARLVDISTKEEGVGSALLCPCCSHVEKRPAALEPKEASHA